MNKKWSIDKSRDVYGISMWGSPYFDINKLGRVEISPEGKKGSKIDLYEVIKNLSHRQIGFPVLLRFPDIINSQLKSIYTCFDNAIKEYNYKGCFKGVYPIKVNQQSHVVNDIVKKGKQYHFGLEVGSKPELLIALSLVSDSESLIICNGFKDRQYIELALMFQKCGKNVVIVIERMDELHTVILVAKKLKVTPQIGFRLKLNTKSTGKWLGSSGPKSKFGLTATQILEGAELLKKNDLQSSLQLLHFHIGSQITSIQPIKEAIREAAHFLKELHKLEFNIKYMDVGGGLGIDYDGSGQSDSSINYTAQEYANDIVFQLQSICDDQNIPHPDIITESGRFLVGQSSILVFDVVDHHLAQSPTPIKDIEQNESDHSIVADLFEIYNDLDGITLTESFNDLVAKKKDIHQLFSYGILSLSEVSKAEKLYLLACAKLQELSYNKDEDIYESLTAELTDTYFCNFSVFQSLPDSWALGHVFPVMPIHRLQENPIKQASLVDLTCDSDGTIHQFMNYSKWVTQKFLQVHEVQKNKTYFLATFLIGAYQEILGDLHNLFGDTEAVHISIHKDGSYTIDHRVDGDCIYDVLKYVQYHRKQLLETLHISMEKGIKNKSLTRKEAGALVSQFEKSLSQTAYLSKKNS